MANFRRRYPRIRTPGRVRHMGSWPAWHDLINHRRPPRRKTKALENAVLHGRDPDTIAWPLGKDGHVYYW